MFDFTIEYKFDWQNSADALFKRKDYKLLNNEKMLIKLFSFLQWKLNKNLWEISLCENINISCEKQIDETEKLKYLISRLLIMKTINKKTACWANTVFKLCEIIEKLQKKNIFSQHIFRKIKDLKTCKWKSVSKQDWSLNKAELLRL